VREKQLAVNTARIWWGLTLFVQSYRGAAQAHRVILAQCQGCTKLKDGGRFENTLHTICAVKHEPQYRDRNKLMRVRFSVIMHDRLATIQKSPTWAHGRDGTRTLGSTRITLAYSADVALDVASI
jgi:hypothetical protein